MANIRAFMKGMSELRGATKKWGILNLSSLSEVGHANNVILDSRLMERKKHHTYWIGKVKLVKLLRHQ